MSTFADMHPGGAGVLLAADIAGQDCSTAFFSLHRSEVLAKYARLKIGRLDTTAPVPYPVLPSGELSPVPHAEPDWLNPKFRSPYYGESHRALQRSMRKFFDDEVKAEARAGELSGDRPTAALVQKMGEPEWDLHAMRMGPGKHLAGKTLPGGVKGEDFDYFVRPSSSPHRPRAALTPLLARSTSSSSSRNSSESVRPAGKPVARPAWSSACRLSSTLATRR